MAFNNFVKRIPKQIKDIKKAKKRYKRQLGKGEATFEIEGISEGGNYDKGFNILSFIKETNIKNKRAVVEFYKSYVEAAKEQKRLFEELDKVNGTPTKHKKNIYKERLQKNADYLNKLDLKSSNDWIVNLSQIEREAVPKELIEEILLQGFKKVFGDISTQIKDIENGWQLKLCTSIMFGITSIIGENPCLNKLISLKKDKESLKRAVDFQALLQLLKDMKKSPDPSFKIYYEEKKRD